jgi:hypothetical protein
MSVRLVCAIFTVGLLAGCGLGGAGSAAAVNGQAAAEDAKTARKQLDKVQADLDAAQKKAAETREAADAAD